MDKLAGMTMFVRVIDNGSFAAAAEIAQVSPAMVAKHIKTIETRLGAKLIHRTTRRHQLTEVGQLYYERCRRPDSPAMTGTRGANICRRTAWR